MNKTALVITSIANDTHSILNQYALESKKYNINFIVIGDKKSPNDFKIGGCDFYSIERQATLGYRLSKNLPTNHYSRKNIGYLAAIEQGAEVIIETDDDNIPLEDFWEPRSIGLRARPIKNGDWVNIYRFFSTLNIWPRGFSLEKILEPLPKMGVSVSAYSPIQQGLADENPDVDAIYRLTSKLPINFDNHENIALEAGSICPFNSQNTTWFKEAFPLLYLPSYCSFRMTDIWRSFVAQRIAWTCGWPIIFHGSTVRQERNEHRLMKDFEDEITGYLNNSVLVSTLTKLSLKDGREHMYENLERCYAAIIKLGLIDERELPLLLDWIHDLNSSI